LIGCPQKSGKVVMGTLMDENKTERGEVMHFKMTFVGLLIVLLLIPGCIRSVQGSADQRRATIDQMEKKTLEELYIQRPASREMLQRAAGYAVFSNITGQYVFFGGGGGYGVAVYKDTTQRVYMKMAQVGVGLGLGLQDIRVIFVFHTNLVLDRFIYQGWDFGGQIDVAATSEGKGGSLGGEISVYPGVDVYTLTKSGLMAKVNLVGTKYWKDKVLNY